MSAVGSIFGNKQGRSREGAWIEIRETLIRNGRQDQGRSREGAWIEMEFIIDNPPVDRGRSREGAWIEIVLPMHNLLIVGSRSREGAWIEMRLRMYIKSSQAVAPARERGLKCSCPKCGQKKQASLP